MEATPFVFLSVPVFHTENRHSCMAFCHVLHEGCNIAVANEVANGNPHIVCAIEALLVEIMDVEFYGDELQAVVLWNNDTHCFTCEFNNLLKHRHSPAVAFSQHFIESNFERLVDVLGHIRQQRDHMDVRPAFGIR
jgi:hypothetical protein